MLLGSRRFPVELDSVTKAVEFIVSSCQSSGVELHCLPRLLLACDELITNIFYHGCHDTDQDPFVDVAIHLESDFLSVRIEDNTRPFTPQSLPPRCNFGSSAQSIGTGGLGIYLVFQVLDCFEHHEENNKNVNILKISASGTANPAHIRKT